MITSATHRRSRHRRVVLVLAVALAAISLVLSMWGIDRNAFADALAAADMTLLLLALMSVTTSYAVRAYRWRILLRDEGTVGFDQSFWATNLGYLGNNVLPARAGELLRSAALSRATGIRLGYVLATAFVERLYDTVGLLLIAALAVLVTPDPPGLLSVAVLPMFVVSAAAFGLLLLGPKALLGYFSRWPRFARVTSRVAGPVEDFARGTRSLRGASPVTRFTAATFVAWSLDALAALLVVGACGFAIRFDEALVFIAVLAFASALPSTPGYLGLYQLVAVSVLPPFGVSREGALAAVILLQGATLVVSIGFGLLGARLLAGQAQRLSAAGRETPAAAS